MKKYSAYIFDMDGTLLDTSVAILDSLYKAIIECGLKISRKKIHTGLIGYKIGDIVDILGLGKNEDIKSVIVAKFRGIYDANAHKNVEWYDCSRELISNLIKEKATIFIATNKPSRATNLILKELNIDFAKDVYYPDKYEDRILNKIGMVSDIISKYKLKASNVIVIGDTDIDFNAARENNCDFGFAKHGYSENTEFLSANADFIYGD